MIWLADKLVWLIKLLTNSRPYTQELSDEDRIFLEEFRKKYYGK